MDRHALFFAPVIVLATACGGGTDDPSPMDTPDAGFQLDAFIPPDAGFIQLGDAGEVGADVGFQDPATLAQGFQSIGNVRMYTHVRGTLTSTMPPVVFVSTGPFLGNEYLIAPMNFLIGPSAAAPDRLHIYYDMRATGQSAFTPTNSSTTGFSGHLEDLGNVLDWAEGWLGTTNTTFDIVGHGYGAGLAALYAADHPERISRLVLVTPHPSNVRQHAEWYGNWDAALTTSERQLLQDITRWDNCLRSIPQCSLDYWNIIGPGWMCPQNESLFTSMTFEHVEMRSYWADGFVNLDLREMRFDWSEDFGRVRAPTTIIAGACDPIPAEAAQVYTSSIAGSQLFIFDDSGHFPFVESPARFQRIVKQALTY